MAAAQKQSQVHFRSVLTRGLNIQGQLGLRNHYQSVEDFRPVAGLQNQDVERIVSSDSQNLALINQRYQLMYWGWPMCTRTTYRFIEQFEMVPRLVSAIQRYTPFFKSGIETPEVEASFEYPVKQIAMGTGYITVVDEKNHVYSWGDNYAGQLGTKDDIHRDQPHFVQSLAEVDVTQISLGFQHQLFLSKEGHAYGVGKNSRFQLGKYWNHDTQHGEIFDRYQGAKRIQSSQEEEDNPYFNGEKLKQVAAGKFHTLFLTESGKVYSVGFNKYGQLGVANSLYMHAEEPIEVFTDGVKIKQIDAGWHHNLLLGDDGNLYGFGARWNGQMDGESHKGRQEQCSMTQIRLPDDDQNRSPIVSFKASNLRSQLVRENGEYWFWGGYFYRDLDKLFIADFNLLNEEEGIPQDKTLIQHEMGFAHDSVLFEEAPSELVTRVEHEYYVQEEAPDRSSSVI